MFIIFVIFYVFSMMYLFSEKEDQHKIFSSIFLDKLFKIIIVSIVLFSIGLLEFQNFLIDCIE